MIGPTAVPRFGARLETETIMTKLAIGAIGCAILSLTIATAGAETSPKPTAPETSVAAPSGMASAQAPQVQAAAPATTAPAALAAPSAPLATPATPPAVAASPATAVTQPTGEAGGLQMSSAEDCLKVAFDLAQSAEAKKLADSEIDSLEDMLVKMETQCADRQYAEAMTLAGDIKGLIMRR